MICHQLVMLMDLTHLFLAGSNIGNAGNGNGAVEFIIFQSNPVI